MSAQQELIDLRPRRYTVPRGGAPFVAAKPAAPKPTPAHAFDMATVRREAAKIRAPKKIAWGRV